MEYAQLNEALTEAIQVATHGNVEWDANNLCSADALTRDGKAEQFRVVPLTATEPPEYDAATQTVVRDGCEEVDGTWRYKWRIDELTPEQIEAARIASIPQSVSIYAAERMLLEADLLTMVKAALANAGPLAELAWARRLNVRRDDPLVAQMAQGFEWSEAFVDDLFIGAKVYDQ